MAVAAQNMQDRLPLGIGMMLAAWLLFALLDTGAKWLVLSGLAVVQMVFLRYFGHFVIVLVLALRQGCLRESYQSDYTFAVISRAAMLASATLLNFYALQFLPLTVSSAIMFASPIMICLLSIWVLDEKVGLWRWGAIALGFAGVLLVIRPWGVDFHWAMVLPVWNAFALSCYTIQTRRLAGKVATQTMQIWLGTVGSVLLAPFAITYWQAPAGAFQWLVLASFGVLGWAGHQLLTNAHRFGSASALTPYTYFFLIYMTVLGFAVFGTVPDVWVLVGAMIIVASGLIIWMREAAQ